MYNSSERTHWAQKMKGKCLVSVTGVGTNAPTEQLAKRKYEDFDPEQLMARPNLILSRADYNRSVGTLLLEEHLASDMAATNIHGAKIESEFYFDILMKSMDQT